MNRTPFHSEHARAGARFMDFGGWDMPVQFEGILAEHRSVRERAGIFDISHMGQIWVSGPAALICLQKLVTNDVEALADGMGLYALLCREDGGVLDDLYIYRLEQERFLVIANASRAAVDLPWMRRHAGGHDVKLLQDIGPGGLAIQGPNAETILIRCGVECGDLRRNGVKEARVGGSRVVVSRTGYTGEDGFELFGSAEGLTAFYTEILKAGEPLGLRRCGLGARDTLRLEMGYRLYGNDLDEQHTALEAGLGWVVKLGKPDFMGREALSEERSRGSRRRFVAFRLKEKGIPRHGHPIYFGDRQAGEVTSGTFSPSLQFGIGMGYVDAAKGTADAGELTVEIHGRRIPAESVGLPFYKKRS